MQREVSPVADSWEWPTAAVLGTGLDSLSTAGVGHTQMELGSILGDKILSGQILCCPKTVRFEVPLLTQPWVSRQPVVRAGLRG